MIAALLATLLAAERPVVVSALTTERLARYCEGKDTDPASDFCTAYILGVFDSLSAARRICPSVERASTRDVVAAARRFVRDHPERWSRAPSFVVRDALRSAFPCGRQRGSKT